MQPVIHHDLSTSPDFFVIVPAFVDSFRSRDVSSMPGEGVIHSIERSIALRTSVTSDHATCQCFSFRMRLCWLIASLDVSLLLDRVTHDLIQSICAD